MVAVESFPDCLVTSWLSHYVGCFNNLQDLFVAMLSTKGSITVENSHAIEHSHDDGELLLYRAHQPQHYVAQEPQQSEHRAAPDLASGQAQVMFATECTTTI